MSTAAPSTLTIMFTDLVASTEFASQRGERKAHEVISAHRELVRTVVAQHHGTEVKWTGDGFLVTFTSAGRAVACAAAIQRALADHNRRHPDRHIDARIGLHTGDVLADESDVFGIAVNAAARIMAHAEGRQVLASDIVRALAGEVAGVTFEPHGTVELRGLEGSWPLVEIVATAARAATPVFDVSATAPLVGRQRELAALTDVIDRRGTVFIEGEAGIGKSRLTLEALRHAESAGCVVLYGRAESLDVRPFGPIIDAFALDPRSPDPMRAAIARSLTDGDTAQPAEGTRVLQEVVALLEDMASTSDVALVLEDLHWADGPTIQTLRAVARRLTGQGLVMILNLRPEPRSAELDRALEAFVKEGAVQLRVGPLADDEVTDLVTVTLEGDPGSKLLEVARGATGNPLYITELVRALDEDGAITRDGSMVDVGDATFPPDLRLTILRRLSALPADTLELLGFASVLGSAFALDDLAIFAKRSVIEASKILAPAVRAGVLGETGDRLLFRHDLIRDAIYEDMPAPVRKSMHLEAARALSAAGRTVVHVAPHWSLGADVGDEQAMEALIEAGHEMGIRDGPASVMLIERALELTPVDHARRDEVRLQLCHPYVMAGRAEEALAIAQDVLETHPTGELELIALDGLSFALVALGRVSEALDVRYRIIDHPDTSDRVRGAILGEMSTTVVLVRGPDDGEAIATRAIETGKRSGRVYPLAAGYLGLTLTALVRRDLRTGLENAEIAMRHTDRAWRERSGIPMTALVYSAVLSQSDRIDDAKSALRTGYARAVEAGINHDSVYACAMPWVSFVQGEWDDALAEAQTGFDLAVGLSTPITYWMAAAVTVAVPLFRGAISEASAAAERAKQDAGPGEIAPGLDAFFWAEALLAEANGDNDTALATLEAVWAGSEGMRFVTDGWRLYGPDLVRLAMSAGRHDLARDIAAQMNEVADLMDGVTSARAAALRAEALVTADPRKAAEAAQLLAPTARRVEYALAAEASADPALMREAADVFASIGARRLEDRVDAALRSAGVKRGRRGPRKRPATGYDALTPTELRIVDLVAEGLTNAAIGEQLFISPRTVGTHLRNIFSKLGCSTRAEVAAEHVRRSAVPAGQS